MNTTLFTLFLRESQYRCSLENETVNCTYVVSKSETTVKTIMLSIMGGAIGIAIIISIAIWGYEKYQDMKREIRKAVEELSKLENLVTVQTESC
jgi:uncharacterized membrane protein